MHDKIVIKGAREHNLKNIDVDIPRHKLVVITGLLDVERLEALRHACAEHQVDLERLHFALDRLVAAS